MTAVVKPTPKPNPSLRQPYRVNHTRPNPEKQALQQRALDSLKRENLDLKKGQNNLQTVTELKYVKARISSLETQIVGKNTEIATLKKELTDAMRLVGQQELTIKNLETQIEHQLETAIDAANNPTGPGATSPALD